MGLKILRVGDPHVKVTNIDESDRLMEFVAAMALEHKVDRIELLGDLFHTHAILRLEVLEFWDNWLLHLSDICEVVVIEGNHDKSGDSNTAYSALTVFTRLRKKNLRIVTTPIVLGVFGYVPYIHESDKFISAGRALYEQGARTLVSHTTYQGSAYENGFYAPDGVDPEQLPFELLISGHIHARQRFSTGKGQRVIYPGTARWDTSSDANQPKGLWLVSHESSGAIGHEEFLDTSHVCAPIISFEVKEGEEIPAWPEGARVKVELIGSSDWITKQKTALKGKCSISAKITDKAKLESRRAGSSLEDFLRNTYVTQMDKERLLKYAKELGLV